MNLVVSATADGQFVHLACHSRTAEMARRFCDVILRRARCVADRLCTAWTSRRGLSDPIVVCQVVPRESGQSTTNGVNRARCGTTEPGNDAGGDERR
jgi:hypothetical protein